MPINHSMAVWQCPRCGSIETLHVPEVRDFTFSVSHCLCEGYRDGVEMRWMRAPLNDLATMIDRERAAIIEHHAEEARRHRMIEKARKAMAEVNWNEQHPGADRAG